MAASIKELVKDNFVNFDSYRQGVFYYQIRYDKTLEDGTSQHVEALFPVPLEDIGTATLYVRDKAILYMRWIRKALEDKTLIEVK